MKATRAILALSCTLAAAGAGAEQPNASCHTVTGEVLSGRVESIDLDGRITLYDPELEETVGAEMADVVRIEFRDARPADCDAIVQLVDGDRLCGTLVEGSADAVVIRNPAIGRVVVPLERLRWFQSRLAADVRWRSRATAIDADNEGLLDVVLLVNGDRVSGLIAEMAPDGVDIEVDGHVQKVPLDRVVALRLAGGEAEESSGLHAGLTFVDGSQVTVSELWYGGESGLRGVYHGHSLVTDAGRLVRVNVLGGRWTPLTSLTPVYEHVAMLSTSWPYRINRNVLGEPLRVEGRTFDAGLGVHSRSALVYELDGAYSEFVTRFGLDDSAGPLADVEVVIRVDGRTAFQKRVAAPAALHDAVRVPVKDARRLELLVDFGANGALQDRFNWIEPGLVR